MTDLIGMEVRSERRTLIKTGDWSPDLLWARRGSVWWEFQRTEIDRAWTAAAGKMPSFSQSLHRISSPPPVYCILHPLCILASRVIADEKFWRAAFTASLTAAGATNRDCDRSRGSNDPRHLRYQWIDTMADYQEVKSHLMKRAKRFIIINLKFSWSGPLSTLGGRAAIRTIWTTISYSFFDVIGPLMRRWGRVLRES